MDPNATLRVIRALLSGELSELSHDDAVARLEELHDRFSDLDNWFICGGFLPAAWERS